jgi:hypothetical protein
LKTALTASVTALFVCAAFWWLVRPGSAPPITGAAPAEGLVAIDANGKQLGPIAGASATLTEAQVVLDTPAGLAIVSLRPNGFAHRTRPFIYFDEANCRGNPLIGVGDEAEEFGVKSALAGELHTLYVAKPGSPELLHVKSVLREPACEPFEHEIHAVAAERVTDLAEAYRAPYRIERSDRNTVK